MSKEAEEAPDAAAEILELLVQHNAGVEARLGTWHVLLLRAVQSFLQLNQLFLQHGQPAACRDCDGAGTSALHFAVLDPASFPNIINLAGDTAGLFGDEAARCEVAEVLLIAGVDVNAPQAQGQTPLHFAARSGLRSAVKLLLARGAELLLRD